MRISGESTPDIQRLLGIEGDLIRKSLLSSPVDKFTKKHPLCELVTRYDFSVRHTHNILKPILPEEEIPQGIENLKDIHSRYHLEPPRLESPHHKHHKKKHHH